MKSTVHVQVSLKKPKYVFIFPSQDRCLKIHELLASFEWKLNREKVPLLFLYFDVRFSVDLKYTNKQDTCAANGNLRCGVAKFIENLANAVLLGKVYLS